MAVRVSPTFRRKIYEPERTTRAKVSFEFLDIDAYEDVAFTVSGEAPISRYSQAVNKMREMTRKYATFERDYFKLDGNSCIPPRPNEGENELGWWSDVLSGEDGTFAIPPVINFTFTSVHSSVGLTITFDKKANEYASDFIIEVFDALGAPLASQTVVGNTEPVYYFETPLDGYKSLKITINKWATPIRRARLVEVDFGVVREYTGETLISLKVIEEMDLLTSLVPSNEIEFVLDNADQQFNMLNPNGVYRFLKLNQEMTAQIGLGIDPDNEDLFEYVSMGKFFLSEWTVDEGAMTTTFIGRDIFTKLDSILYTNLKQQTNLYDLTLDVLTQANVTKYKVDKKLKTRATFGFREPPTVREALQMIGIAGKAVVRQNREGFLIVEQYDELTAEIGYIDFAGPDQFAGTATYPMVDVDYGFQMIDFDGVFEIPRVSLAKPASHLVFKVMDYDGVESEYTYTSPETTQGQGEGFEINNPLINSGPHAAWVAEWMFREYNTIAQYEASWRQNPALECGDIIVIEDNFSKTRKSRITKQEFNFEGYLEGVTEAKGGV